jgi:hypothetical protein
MEETIHIKPIDVLRDNIMQAVEDTVIEQLNAYSQAVDKVTDPNVLSIRMYATAVASLANSIIWMDDLRPPNMSREQAQGLIKAVLAAAVMDVGVTETVTHRQIIGPDGNIKRGDH